MVLLVQLFEPLHIVGFHAAVLVPPAVQRVLRYAELLAHVGPFDARGQLDVGLTQLANDLLGRMTLALHRGSSCPCGRLEPSYHMDQKMGSRTIDVILERQGHISTQLILLYGCGVIGDVMSIVCSLILKTRFPTVMSTTVFGAILAMALNGFWLFVELAVGQHSWP